MKCKLCKQVKILCESHIIPKAFYKAVNDDKNRSVPISTNRTKLEFVQSGITEKLLCQECENKLSEWENTLYLDLSDIGKRSINFLIITRKSHD
jgi:hypothetical protein